MCSDFATMPAMRHSISPVGIHLPLHRSSHAMLLYITHLKMPAAPSQIIGTFADRVELNFFNPSLQLISHPPRRAASPEASCRLQTGPWLLDLRAESTSQLAVPIPFRYQAALLSDSQGFPGAGPRVSSRVRRESSSLALSSARCCLPLLDGLV